MPKAIEPNAPCVAVCESPHTIVMPGSVRPCSGPDHVDDALARVAHREVDDPELGGVRPQGVDLLGRDRVGDRLVDVGRRHVVVLGGDGEVGAAHAAARQAEAVEGLRAGHLVDEVEVDVQQVGFARRGVHHVSFPHLLRQCLRPMACLGHGDSWCLVPRPNYWDTDSCDMDIVTGVGVLDKAMTILGAIESGPRSLGELQAATGLPRATAHRLAAALEAHGLLRRDDDGRFELGPHLVTLGRAAAGRFALIAAATPVLADAARHDRRERAAVRPRGRRPPLRDLARVAPRPAVDRAGGLAAPARPRVVRPGAARRDHRSSGWVESVGEREPGVASVSAPVVDAAGVVVAAIAVSGPIERLSRTPGKRFGRAVADAAQQITP